MSKPDDQAADPPVPGIVHRVASLAGGVPVSGPSGLSDYAVSPLGTPLALMRGEIRVAFPSLAMAVSLTCWPKRPTRTAGSMS